MSTSKQDRESPALGSGRLVRLRLTPEEIERLTTLLGMAANDDGDDDAQTLQSIQRKLLDALPNGASET